MIIEGVLCKKSCWDNSSCRYYYQGQTYDIDTESVVGKLEGIWESKKFAFPKHKPKFVEVEIPVVEEKCTEAAPPSAPAVKAASATVTKKS